MSCDLGIYFDLQWKKKPIGINCEDVASIGIWDTPGSSLDWMTFKSYLCQNLGTTEDIHVAYVDSDGDELPIESECEFQEALKFARHRARKGSKVVLKVDKQDGHPITPPNPESKQKDTASKMSDAVKDLNKRLPCQTVAKGRPLQNIVPYLLPGGKTNRATCSVQESEMLKTSNPSGKRISSRMEERKQKIEDHSISHELSKKLACIMKLETEKRKKVKVDKDDAPPAWFKKYMQKFKNEIVAEITTNVMCNTRQILESVKVNNSSTCSCERGVASTAVSKSKKKKKTTDDDSSDCAMSSDQRDHKLLKKIEKLHKREKKLEKKLDSKLEKWENKTKRRMEKKLQSKSCSEPRSELKTSTSLRKRLGELQVVTYLMDAIPLNDGPKPAEIHIRLGERFTKVWEIMNSGTLPWTDKTELRLAWGTSGLEPEATILKCPILQPGEKGQIAVTFRAPEFPGTFESYWHFYHMGDRFGHWLGCAVVVDSKEPEKEAVDVCKKISAVEFIQIGKEKDKNKVKADQPVDLTMKSEPEEVKMVKMSVEHKHSAAVTENEATDKDKMCSKTAAEESRQENAEYESDSDDENLSVISGTISLTSDTEEDENFVVVPMPACFMCDVPLEKIEKAGNLTVETSTCNIVDTKEETEADLLDMSNNNKADECSSMNISFKTTSEELSTDAEHLTTEFMSHESMPASNAENVFRSPEISRSASPFNNKVGHEKAPYAPESFSQKNVFAIDLLGYCIPVNRAWQESPNQEKIGSDETSTTSENGTPMYSKTYSRSDKEESRKGDTSQNCEDFSVRDSVPFRAHVTHPRVTSQNCEDFSVGDSIPFRARVTRPGFHIHSECEDDCEVEKTEGFCHTFNNVSSHSGETKNRFQHNKTHTSTTNSSHATSQNDVHDQGAAVHILPETLVTGAINVASQALTTARAVFNNLRPSAAEDFPERFWNDSSSTWSSQSERSTTENLKVLLEMGFTNKILNVLLLQRYDNDIPKVVAELLAYKDNPGFTYNRQTQ